MALSSSGLLAYSRTEEARKKLRYAGVAAGLLPLSQGLVQIFGLWFDDYVAATLLAAGIATVPNFLANRHFVWRVTSGEKLRSQMLVFWAVVMMGISLATLFTYLVDNAMASQTILIRGIAVFVAQMLGFGIVFVSRFLILDRWLFKLAVHRREDRHELIGEIPT
jgi:putative flippase GtrA